MANFYKSLVPECQSGEDKSRECHLAHVNKYFSFMTIPNENVTFLIKISTFA